MPYLNPSTHDDRIAITVNLAVLSTGAATFRPLLVAKDITLGGLRTKVYTAVSTATADSTAGIIDAWTLAAIKEVLGQSPRPASVLVGRWSAALPETIDAAMDAIIASNSDFWAICIETRTAADHVALHVWIDGMATDGSKFMAFVQSADVLWKTAAPPAGYATVIGEERIALCFHATDIAPRCEGWVGKGTARSPDTNSVPWNAPVTEVATFTADTVTQAEKVFLRANNANVALPFGTKYDAYFDPGRNLNSRPVDQILSADWFEARLRESLADLIADLAALGQKLGVNADGQNRVAGAISKVALQGVTAGHFEAGQVVITAETITTADKTAQRLRFTIGAQHVVGALALDLTVNLSTTAIV